MTREKQNEDKNQRNSEVTQERIMNQKANNHSKNNTYEKLIFT